MTIKMARVHTEDRLTNQLQNNIFSGLTLLLKNPMSKGSFLKNIVLTTGSNVVPHGLGRALQGWMSTRVRASATFYDTQDTNPNPDKTLVLVSSANVTVDLFVF